MIRAATIVVATLFIHDMIESCSATSFFVPSGDWVCENDTGYPNFGKDYKICGEIGLYIADAQATAIFHVQRYHTEIKLLLVRTIKGSSGPGTNGLVYTESADAKNIMMPPTYKYLSRWPNNLGAKLKQILLSNSVIEDKCHWKLKDVILKNITTGLEGDLKNGSDAFLTLKCTAISDNFHELVRNTCSKVVDKIFDDEDDCSNAYAVKNLLSKIRDWSLVLVKHPTTDFQSYWLHTVDAVSYSNDKANKALQLEFNNGCDLGIFKFEDEIYPWTCSKEVLISGNTFRRRCRDMGHYGFPVTVKDKKCLVIFRCLKYKTGYFEYIAEEFHHGEHMIAAKGRKGYKKTFEAIFMTAKRKSCKDYLLNSMYNSGLIDEKCSKSWKVYLLNKKTEITCESFEKQLKLFCQGRRRSLSFKVHEQLALTNYTRWCAASKLLRYLHPINSEALEVVTYRLKYLVLKWAKEQSKWNFANYWYRYYENDEKINVDDANYDLERGIVKDMFRNGGYKKNTHFIDRRFEQVANALIGRYGQNLDKANLDYVIDFISERYTKTTAMLATKYKIHSQSGVPSHETFDKDHPRYYKTIACSILRFKAEYVANKGKIPSLMKSEIKYVMLQLKKLCDDLRNRAVGEWYIAIS